MADQAYKNTLKSLKRTYYQTDIIMAENIFGPDLEILKGYSHHGFTITHILGDGQFEKMDTSNIWEGVTLNIVLSNEHVLKWNATSELSRKGLNLCTTLSLSRSFQT